MDVKSPGREGVAGVPGGPQCGGPSARAEAGCPSDTGRVFARYFIELPLEAEEVEQALMHDPHDWIPGLARKANFHGDTLLAEVGFGDDVRIERKVEIALGEPVKVAGKTVITLRWVAADGAGLFPSLESDLEVAPLSPGRTQLAMSARYVPPLGAVGRAIDRVVMFRVAEATIKDFLDHVGASLMASEGHGRIATG